MIQVSLSFSLQFKQLVKFAVPIKKTKIKLGMTMFIYADPFLQRILIEEYQYQLKKENA